MGGNIVLGMDTAGIGAKGKNHAVAKN